MLRTRLVLQSRMTVHGDGDIAYVQSLDGGLRSTVHCVRACPLKHGRRRRHALRAIKARSVMMSIFKPLPSDPLDDQYRPTQSTSDPESVLAGQLPSATASSKYTSPISPESKDDTATPLVNGPPLSPNVLFGEFLATFLFVVLSIASAGSGITQVAVAGANGAIIAAVVAAFMPVSGAHLNPAVTAALVVTNRVHVLRAIAFVPIQLVASAAATYLVAASGVSVKASFAGLQTTWAPSALVHALWAECMPMFILVVVVFQTAVAAAEQEPSGGLGTKLSAFSIGLAVFACASTFSGVFNPARAFGPALFLGNWASHWIYWMPVPVAIIAAIMCEHVFIAPSTGRSPDSLLSYISQRLAVLAHRVKNFGLAGLLAYGIMNICYYIPVFTIMWIRVGGLSAGSRGLLTAWGVTWAGSQVTKPLRLLGSLAFAPFIDMRLRKRRIR